MHNAVAVRRVSNLGDEPHDFFQTVEVGGATRLRSVDEENEVNQLCRICAPKDGWYAATDDTSQRRNRRMPRVKDRLTVSEINRSEFVAPKHSREELRLNCSRCLRSGDQLSGNLGDSRFGGGLDVDEWESEDRGDVFTHA